MIWVYKVKTGCKTTQQESLRALSHHRERTFLYGHTRQLLQAIWTQLCTIYMYSVCLRFNPFLQKYTNRFTIHRRWHCPEQWLKPLILTTDHSFIIVNQVGSKHHLKNTNYVIRVLPWGVVTTEKMTSAEGRGAIFESVIIMSFWFGQIRFFYDGRLMST